MPSRCRPDAVKSGNDTASFLTFKADYPQETKSHISHNYFHLEESSRRSTVPKKGVRYEI
jgi:hypothetical protein